MRLPSMLLRVGVLVAASVLVASCEGSGVAVQSIGSTTTDALNSSTTTPATTATVADAATMSPTVSAGSDPEQTDRAAAEAQWIKSWDVYLALATTPADQREALAATVTVDPATTRMLTDAAEFDRQGLQTYGQLGHRITWPQAIGGGNSALIDDCQDRSASGAVQVTSGNKVTVGVARDHYQGNLIRGADGFWRVADVFYLQDEPC